MGELKDMQSDLELRDRRIAELEKERQKDLVLQRDLNALQLYLLQSGDLDALRKKLLSQRELNAVQLGKLQAAREG